MKKNLRKLSASEKSYEVFARQSSEEELRRVGSVTAANDDLARVRAWFVFDEHKWIEMCIVPSDAMLRVMAKVRPVALSGVAR